MCGERSVASGRGSFQKGTCIGDGIAKVVSDLNRRFHAVDTPCSGDPSAEMRLISPGRENLLDFLELRQVLSTYDGDLMDPLW